jgi:hypothetical protein
MQRTTISMPDDLALALSREAHRRHCSTSQIAREALQIHLGLTPGTARSLPFAAVGHGGQGSTGRDLEQLLEREWNEPDRAG